MIAVALTLTLAALPCSDVSGLRAKLTQAASGAGWQEQLDQLAAKADPVWIAPPEAMKKEEAAKWVADRVEAICAARGLEAANVEVDRARLGAILARPEFSHESSRGRALAQWIERAIDWLMSFLQSGSARGFAEWTRTAVLTVALLVIAFGVARLSRVRRRKGQTAAAAKAPEFTLAPAADHLDLARSALSSDARTAIRHGWLALLSALERRRLARPDRVKTNREVVAELAGRGASASLVERVAPLVDWFDRRFYSLAPVPSEDAAGFLERVASLTAELTEVA